MSQTTSIHPSISPSDLHKFRLVMGESFFLLDSHPIHNIQRVRSCVVVLVPQRILAASFAMSNEKTMFSLIESCYGCASKLRPRKINHIQRMLGVAFDGISRTPIS